MKVGDENRRIRIHYSDAWIRGSESTPKCHGSATLVSGLFGSLQVQGKERGEDVGAAAAHLPLQAAYSGHGEADRRHPPHGGDGGGQEHTGRPVLAPPSLPGRVPSPENWRDSREIFNFLKESLVKKIRIKKT